jgi:hypothetical protein
LLDSVWQSTHNKQYSTFGKLLRRNEEQNFDHPNVQIYIQDYATLGNDNQNLNTTTATLAPVVTGDIVLPNQL